MHHGPILQRRVHGDCYGQVRARAFPCRPSSLANHQSHRDRSSLYTGTGYVSDQTTPEYTVGGTLASPTVTVVGGEELDGTYTGANDGVNRGR